MSNVLTTERPPELSRDRSKAPRLRAVGFGDKAFKGLTLFFALSILAIAIAIAWQLWKNSALSRHAFGWSFLFKKIWDPVAEDFGALTFVYGTLVSSAVALLIAVPLGVGVAIFLSELA